MFSTIYISSSSIKVMTVKGNAVSKWAVRQLEPGLVRDGKILDPPKVGAGIASLFESLSISRSNAVITVSGLPYTYRRMDFPKMRPEQVKEAMSFNAPAEFTASADSIYVSWAPVNINQEAVEYFVIGVNRQFVDAIIETANFAGISDWSLDIRPLALARAAAQTDAIVVSLDYDYMDMVLVRDGKVREMHSATVDMEAEDFSRGNYTNLFAAELSKLVSYHMSNHKDDLFGNNIPVVVTGETLTSFLEKTDSEGILQELNSATGYPVQYLKASMPYPKDFNAEPYAINIGLALRKLKGKAKESNGFHDINLDLIMGEFDKKPQTLSFGYIVFPALLVMIVGIITAVTGANGQIKADVADLEEQLDHANQSLVVVHSAQAKVVEVQKKLDSAAARLRAAKAEHLALLGNKGSNAPDLTAITNALPPETDFRTISMNGNVIKVTGIVTDPFAVVGYFRALESAGFSGVNISYVGDADADGNYPFTISINEKGKAQ